MGGHACHPGTICAEPGCGRAIRKDSVSQCCRRHVHGDHSLCDRCRGRRIKPQPPARPEVRLVPIVVVNATTPQSRIVNVSVPREPWL